MFSVARRAEPWQIFSAALCRLVVMSGAFSLPTPLLLLVYFPVTYIGVRVNLLFCFLGLCAVPFWDFIHYACCPLCGNSALVCAAISFAGKFTMHFHSQGLRHLPM